MSAGCDANGRTRGARVTRALLLGLAALILLGAIGFVAWANTGVMSAEAEALAAVESDPRVTVTDHANAIVMSPAHHPSRVGLVFVPGAKVAAEAYLYNFSAAVKENGLTLVITKPPFNLALFDLRALSSFTDDAPDVTTWYVGGHSLGGFRACQYAEQPDVHGLLLLGSYCANDLAQRSLRVVSIGGSEDSLSTPQKIAAAAGKLPADTEFVEIPGSNHAQFGNYGAQAGDGRATVSDEQVRSVMTRQVAALLQAPD